MFTQNKAFFISRLWDFLGKWKGYSSKLTKFAQILGNLNNTSEPILVQRFSKIKGYNALTVPILLYGREIWALRRKDKKRLARIKMKFFRRAGCTLRGQKMYEEILEELKGKSVDEKLRTYKSNWLRHVTRMNNNRMPTIMLNYKLKGWRRFGRPLKRLLTRPKQAYRGLTREGCQRIGSSVWNTNHTVVRPIRAVPNVWK